MADAYYGDDDRAEQQALAEVLRQNPALGTPTQGQLQRAPLRRPSQGQMADPNAALPEPWLNQGGYQPNAGVPQGSLRPVTSADVPAQQRAGLPQAVAAQQGQAPVEKPGAIDQRKAYASMQEQLDLMRKPVDVSGMEEAARNRYEAAGGDMAAAMMLQGLGGRAFSGMGGQVLTQALKARQPYEVPGGYGTIEGGQFVPNEYKMREAEIGRLGQQAALHATMANQAETAEERERHNKAVEAYQSRANELANDQRNLTRDQTQLQRQQMQTNEKFRQTSQVREQYQTRAAKVIEASAFATTLNNVMNAKDINTNAERQIALIMSFGKMLDPDSVVREAEQRMIANARGLFDTWEQFIPKLRTGALLTPTQITQIKAIAGDLLQASQGRADAMKQFYADIAKRNQLDVRDIIIGYVEPSAAQGAPGSSASAPLVVPHNPQPAAPTAPALIPAPARPTTSGGRQMGPYRESNL